MMFRDFEYDNINSSNLTAESFGNLKNTIKPSRIVIPPGLKNSSPLSLQQGLEVTGAKMYSSLTSNKVHITNDDPQYIKNNFFNYNIIDNKPSYNSVGDYMREYEICDKNGIVKSTIIVEGDGKNRALGLLDHPKVLNEPQVVCVGTVSSHEEEQMVSNIAFRAITGQITVTHLDPKSNKKKEIDFLLQKAIKTGDVDDLIHLAGIPFIISNRHNE